LDDKILSPRISFYPLRSNVFDQSAKFRIDFTENKGHLTQQTSGMRCISQTSETFRDDAIDPKQKATCTNSRTATVLHVLRPSTVP
jgi:hypothetical protein